MLIVGFGSMELDSVHERHGVNNKVIVPTDEEVERNPRARSAKLRIAEKE